MILEDRVDMPVVKGCTQVALRWRLALSTGSNLQTATFYSTDDGNSGGIGGIHVFHTSVIAASAVNNRNDIVT